MSWSYTELRKLKNAWIGVAHFLCNYVTNVGQRWSYLGSSCSREPIQNVDNSIASTSTFIELYNSETDNNDNSSTLILSKQWTFYQCFSELAHFSIRNYYVFSLLDNSCEKDIGSTVFLVACGFQMCSEGEVPPQVVYHPRDKIRNCFR